MLIRLSIFTGGLLMAVLMGGWTHGSAAIEGATWKETLAQVPCPDVAKDGRDLKIDRTLIVDGVQYPDPVITKEDLIEELDRKCFPKH